MHLVILSDIHGNNVALQKVLENVGESMPQFVCLGDVAWGGPQPSEVVSEIRRLSCPVIMGNTDEFLIGKNTDKIQGRWKQVERWCNQTLSNDDRTFIRSYKPTVTVNLGGGDDDALCYHGSPRSNTEGILPTTPDTDIALMLRGHREKILIGGHTHSQMLRRSADRLIINPGSVGMPIEYTHDWTKKKNSPWAEFATIDQVDGNISVALNRVQYDFQELKEMITASDMPHRDWWIKDWRA